MSAVLATHPRPLLERVRSCGSSATGADERGRRGGGLKLGRGGLVGGGIDRLGPEGRDSLPGAGEVGGRELAGDLVALASGLVVALRRSRREPEIGLDEVLAHAEAAGIEHREVCTGCRARPCSAARRKAPAAVAKSGGRWPPGSPRAAPRGCASPRVAVSAARPYQDLAWAMSRVTPEPFSKALPSLNGPGVAGAGEALVELGRDPEVAGTPAPRPSRPASSQMAAPSPSGPTASAWPGPARHPGGSGARPAMEATCGKAGGPAGAAGSSAAGGRGGQGTGSWSGRPAARPATAAGPGPRRPARRSCPLRSCLCGLALCGLGVIPPWRPRCGGDGVARVRWRLLGSGPLPLARNA